MRVYECVYVIALCRNMDRVVTLLLVLIFVIFVLVRHFRLELFFVSVSTLSMARIRKAINRSC